MVMDLGQIDTLCNIKNTESFAHKERHRIKTNRQTEIQTDRETERQMETKRPQDHKEKKGTDIKKREIEATRGLGK
jgi:hypothetical protein